jgi:hypothetical protein
VVGVATLRSTQRVFTIERRWTIPLPEPAGTEIWLMRNPAVAVSPQGAKDVWGTATVEIVLCTSSFG